MKSPTTIAEAFAKADALDVPLNQRLAAYARWHRDLSPIVAQANERLINTLASASSGGSAPNVGQPMPPFVLPDHDGRLVALEEVVRSGPAVVSFNRGHWCTYCKLELSSLAREHQELERRGVRTISIVPDRQAYASRFKAVLDLPFSVLTDIDNGYTLTLGLAIRVGEELKTLLPSRGIDLAEYQGNSGWFLPIPATYVVAQDGLIRARFVDPDFRQRMEIERIFDAIRAATG